MKSYKLVCACVFLLLGAALHAQGTGGTPIRWSDNPLVGLRSSYKNGQTITYTCPPGGTPWPVTGTDVYLDDSYICAAAVHAGRITLASGGTVTIRVQTPGQNEYKNSNRNGITSRYFNNGPNPTQGAFTFIDTPTSTADTGSAGSSAMSVQLDVTVSDNGGQSISGAHVSVFLSKSWLGSSNQVGGGMIVTPPDLNKDTDPNGNATFEIPLKLGQRPYIDVEVARDGMQSQRQSAQVTNTSMPIFMYFKLLGASQVGHSVAVRFDVLDQDAAAVDGATVEVVDPYLIDKSKSSGYFTKVTGSDGSVRIDVSIPSGSGIPGVAGTPVATHNYRVSAFKDGYERSAVKIITLHGKDVGREVYGTDLLLKEVAASNTATSTAAHEVTIHVSGSDATGQTIDIEGAQVQLHGSKDYPGKTDSSGNATITVNEYGNLAVNITQADYQPYSDSIEVKGGEVTQGNYTLTLKPQANNLPPTDIIYVTVLARQDPSDPTSKTSPVGGASVRAGSVSSTTDASGMATLHTPTDLSQDVSVSAPGYKTTAKTVSLNKLLPTSRGRASATFILVPDTSAEQPLKLIVRVLGKGGQGVPDVTVFVYTLADTGSPLWAESTNANGEVSFTSAGTDVSPTELRRGLTVKVQGQTKGYKQVANQLIPGGLLQPRPDANVYLVQLEKDYTDLANAIAELEPRVAAWNSDWQSTFPASDQTDKFVDQALIARKAAEESFSELTAAHSAYRQAALPQGGSVNDTVSTLKKNIQADATEADQAAKELKQTLDDANALAAKCSSTADAEAIRSDYNKAIRLLAQIGTFSKEAVKFRDELTPIAAAYIAFWETGREKVNDITLQAQLAQDVANSAAAYYAHLADVTNSLTTRKISLVAALSTLQVKFSDDLAGWIPDYPADYAPGGATPSSDLIGLRSRIAAMYKLLNAHSLAQNTLLPVLPEAARSVPQSITDAVSRIAALKAQAEQTVPHDDPHVDTMDQTVDGIDTTLQNASFDVGLAVDVRQQADDCEKAAAAKTPAAGEVVAALPEDQPPATTLGETPQNTTPTNRSNGNPGDCQPHDVLQQVEALMHQATVSATFAQGDAYLAQADVLAAPYRCIVVELGNFEGLWGTYKRSFNAPPGVDSAGEGTTQPNVPAKTNSAVNPMNLGGLVAAGPAVEMLPEDQPHGLPAATASNGPPTVEALPEDQPGAQGGTGIPAANRGSPIAPTSSLGTARAPAVEALPEDQPGAQAANNRGQVPPWALSGAAGTVGAPVVEQIPEDTLPISASNYPPPVYSPPPETSQPAKPPRDPNQPSGWEKLGTLLGGVIEGLSVAEANNPNNGGNNGGGGYTPMPQQPGAGNSSSNGPQSRGNAPGTAKVDLSGNWEIANIAPSSAPCRVWVDMRLQADGADSWSGPETVGNNCNSGDMAGAMIAQMFQGMQGTVTVVSTNVGQCRWTLKTNTGQSNMAGGSYDASEIDLIVQGESVKFLRKQ